jgi:hypothetical protein
MITGNHLLSHNPQLRNKYNLYLRIYLNYVHKKEIFTFFSEISSTYTSIFATDYVNLKDIFKIQKVKIYDKYKNNSSYLKKSYIFDCYV